MNEILAPEDRYEIRPTGRLLVHDGLLKDHDFDKPDQAIEVLKDTEKISKNLSIAAVLLSAPLAIFSAIEVASGFKNKKNTKLAKGIVGAAVLAGLLFSSRYLGETTQQANLEIEDMEDLISSHA